MPFNHKPQTPSTRTGSIHTHPASPGALRQALVIAALICALLSSAPAPAAQQNVKDRIAAAAQTHPRLFLAPGQEASLKAKIDSDTLMKQVFLKVSQAADAMMDLPPVVYKKDGRRLLGRSRECLKRVSHLAFMHRITGEPRYATRARQEMLAAAAFKDWNPSHFLDVAEMTAALALGYDWLYAQLDTEARATIRAAIIEKGLKTSFASRWPVKGTNNWGQVCHGGLVMGALAVMEDEPELAAQVIERALANIHFSMDAYKPDGTYPEGPGYWGYGTSFNVLLIEALSTALGTDFDLAKQPGFMQTANYYLHVHGPTGLAFNYADGGAHGEVEPALFWFASKLKQPSLLWMERRKLLASSGARVRATGSVGRLMPFLLLWADAQDGITAPDKLHYQGQGETAITMHRNGWDERSVFAGLKGGSPSSSHGHMDIGSFIMESDGVRWAADLGAQDYNSLESRGISLWNGKQDGERWTVFRLNNFSHNTLVVDGKLQQVASFSKIIKFSPSGTMPHSILDMTPAYQAQLARAVRGVGMPGGKTVLIQDEIQAPGREAEVRWAMLTGAQVALDGSRAMLTQDGQRLDLRVIAPAGARLEIYPSNPPPAPYDAANPRTQMVGFKVKLAPAASQRLVVLLTPGGTPAQLPNVRPLAEW